jgi:hypothetical protein
MYSQRVTQVRTSKILGQGDSLSSKPSLSTPASVHPILELQQTVGNRAVQRLLRSRAIQAKLSISRPDDVYEQEADRVAEHVMRMPESTLQRTCASCATGGAPCPKCQDEKRELVQRKTQTAVDSADAAVPDNLLQSLGPGRPLDASTRAFFEPRFGHDFRDVRVHTDAPAAESAQAVNALAYTVGSDVVFAGGEYAPHTAMGKKLLAHELVHVAQQEPASKGNRARLQRAVRSVSCHNPTGRVREIVGNDPLATVQAADARAIELLDNAIEALASTQAQIRGGEPAAAGWPTISDRLGMALRDWFGVTPEDPELWTSSRHVTVRGVPTIALLLFRLRRVREVLAAGGVRYRCLDRPPCPPMSKPNEVVIGAVAFADSQEYRIYLCEGFWRFDSRDERALTLVHEAFHIYFDAPLHAGRNMWNPFCIEIFVAEAGGVPIPEGYERCCAPGGSCEY